MTGRPKHDYDELAREAKGLIESGEMVPSFTALHKHFGIPLSTLRGGLQDAGITTTIMRAWANQEATVDLPDEPSEYDEDALAVFSDKKQVRKVDWREIASIATQVQSLERDIQDTQRIAEVRIDPSLETCAIMFTSDWHMGDLASDHKQWVEDMEYVLNTYGLFMIDLGDSIQNMRSFKVLAAVLSQAITPKMQGKLLRGIVDELTDKNKLLAKVIGNHDGDFDERIFGERLQSYLLEKMRAPLFSNRGMLRIIYGEQTYYLLLFHKSRFRSILRGAHGAYREYEFSAPADIIAGGHDHKPALEWINHYTLAKQSGMGIGGGSWLIKTGTYQDSDYGWKYFHNGGQIQNFTAVLHRDEKDIDIFLTPQKAIAFMQGWKEAYYDKATKEEKVDQGSN